MPLNFVNIPFLQKQESFNSGEMKVRYNIKSFGEKVNKVLRHFINIKCTSQLFDNDI